MKEEGAAGFIPKDTVVEQLYDAIASHRGGARLASPLDLPSRQTE